jgi:hypothetical protein
MPFLPPIFRKRIIRQLGWLQNKADPRDYDFDMLGLPEGPGGVQESLLDRKIPRLNQGSIPSCVGNAIANAIMIRERAVGFDPEIPSRLYLYFNARRKRQKPVRVTGTYIRDAMKMMTKVGVPDEVFWPYSTRKRIVNKRPSWDAIMMAHSRRGGEYYTIQTYGNQRLKDIRIAIDNSLPVVFGTPVDSKFLQAEGPMVVRRPTGDLVGGHAMVVTGYRKDPNGEWLFEVLNSWGDKWRNNGVVWLHESYFRWARTSDLTVIRGWDKLRKGKR